MYNYNYMYEFSDFDAGMFALIGGIVLIVLLAVAAVGLLSYILRSAGVYSVAKRRGIHHAWMAWIPVLSSWVLGCISDQYQYLVKGKNTRRRIILLVFAIVSFVLSTAGSVSYLAAMGNTFQYAATSSADAMDALAPMLTMWGFSLIASGVSIVAAVFRYMSMYDLYSAANPQYSVLFLVLSIFFGITEPFFVFFNRKKDLGMPPRKPEYRQPEFQPPVYQQPQQQEEE